MVPPSGTVNRVEGQLFGDDELARQMAAERLGISPGSESQAFPLDLGGTVRAAGTPNSAMSASLLACAVARNPQAGEHLPSFAVVSSPAVRGAPLSFDAAHGQLSIQTSGPPQMVQEAVSPDGFVEVTIGGQLYSSNPRSAGFDTALSGVTAGAVQGIRFAGSGQDTLILDSQQRAGGLTVQATGATVVTQNLVTAGPLTVQASNITVSGALHGSSVSLAAPGWISVDAAGRIDAAQDSSGGRIALAAGVFSNSGQLHADGTTGGQIAVQAGNILNAGPVTADALALHGAGGQAYIAFSRAYVATTAAVVSASSVAGPGGQVTLDGGSTGRLYTSGRQVATGSVGGAVALLGREVVLAGATVDASGTAGGGSADIGGDFRSSASMLTRADSVIVMPATTIRANALDSGSGGHVIVGASQATVFEGTVAARGGPRGGSGGRIEVSAQGSLNYGGSADAGAPFGKSGTLLLDPKNIEISAAPVGIFPQFDLIDPHPTVGGSFGSGVVALGNGNVIVTNPNDDFGGLGAGAVYLFDGITGALMSSLVASNPGDHLGATDPTIGSRILQLANSNYLILNPVWNNGTGAVTWASGSAGISGVVSEANSLIGSTPEDRVGSAITLLSNGNYLVLSAFWNQYAGAVTWGNESTGVRGVLSEANSLVGNPGDTLGYAGPGNASIIELSNGNYLVPSPNWNDGRGAVTWGNGNAEVRGLVSEANSLVGSNPGDLVGLISTVNAGYGTSGITLLSNGNYLITSPNWSERRGAVTWGDGTIGVHGVVSDANSLVGSTPGDLVGVVTTDYGRSGIVLLSNGNYVVASSNWNDQRGAVTWGNESTGISGVLSEANSLVGSTPGDQVANSAEGIPSITLLSNGNYLVLSPNWNSQRGAVTWGNATREIKGTVSEANSLVGSFPGDQVGSGRFSLAVLSNGNYVVKSPSWNDQRGAATWGNGSTGISGIISGANSLVGSAPGDQVASGPYNSGGITVLTNGSYVVQSPSWNGQRGAVTWGSGSTGVSGTISQANSLVGSDPNDLSFPSVTPLSNGNYVVASPYWNGQRGAVTWGSGTTGIRGTISEANSLVGSNVNDEVGGGEYPHGPGGVTPLSNGNYVVSSPSWNGGTNGYGAVTWGNGSIGVRGTISEANSLIGDSIGLGVIPLTNGNYVVDSPYWGGQRGAVTWGNGSTGVRGIVSAANSLVGSYPSAGERFPGDGIGSSKRSSFGLHADGVWPLNNGNYLVFSPAWNGNAGAVTWGSGSAGVSGVLSAANSLVGNPGDGVAGPGFYGYFGPITLLSNGDYLIVTLTWNNKRGAVIWGNGSTGTSGTVSEVNSLVGTTPGDQVGSDGLFGLSNGSYLVRSLSWNGNCGAVTWVNGPGSCRGTVSEANSLVGSHPGGGPGSASPGDLVGLGGPFFLSNGNYVVGSTNWNAQRGAVTWGNGVTGVHGTVSEANSLVGSSPGDQVGSVTPLSNGNYVAFSRDWNAQRGAATWVSGTSGKTLDGQNTITPENSILGKAAHAGIQIPIDNPSAQTFLTSFVSEGGGRVTAGFSDPNLLTYATAQNESLAITPEFLTSTLNTGTAVVLQASNDITIDSLITVSAGGHGGALTLQAGRSIALNAPITTDNGTLNLVANDPVANGVVDSQRDPGPAVINMAPGTFLNTGSGNLTVELRDGAGLTNSDSGGITLQAVTAGSVWVINDGPSAGSDVNLGPVTSRGSQYYASPQGTTRVAGNLAAGDSSIRFTDGVVVNDGVTVMAGANGVFFAGKGTQTLQSGSSTQFGNVNHPGTGTLQLTSGLSMTGCLVNEAGIFDTNNQPVNVAGLAAIIGGTYLAGTAPERFGKGLTIAGGLFTSSSEPMSIAGGITLVGGLLSGVGTVDTLTAHGGTVASGSNGPGVLTVSGSTTFNAATTLSMALNGVTVGSGYSQLAVGGRIDLGGSTLSVSVGFEPPVGSKFEIVNNTGSAPITGTFAGLSEGAVFPAGGYQFQITYQGGPAGNSVVLTRLA